MQSEPRDLDRTELEALLEARWSIRADSLEFLPVGFGGHHWAGVDAQGSRRFVTAHDLEASSWLAVEPDAAFATLDRAYRTASFLRDEARLEFVLAPLPDAEGSLTSRLGRYAVALFPFIPAASGAKAIAALFERLHRATDLVPADLPRREDFSFQNKASLLRALDDIDRPWHGGPFSEATRELLGTNAARVRRLVQRHDELAAELAAAPEPWVVTHGEPHAGNVIRDDRGRLHVVDWDTVRLAPRERDLWMLPGAGGRPAGLRFYRCHWDLSDTAEYVDRFRRPHERTADTVKSWRELAEILDALVDRPS